jgi:hypothetical protein
MQPDLTKCFGAGVGADERGVPRRMPILGGDHVAVAATLQQPIDAGHDGIGVMTGQCTTGHEVWLHIHNDECDIRAHEWDSRCGNDAGF